MLTEKRQFERSDIFLIVEFRSLDRTSGINLGVTNNISNGGLSFDSQSSDLNVGEMLNINLKDAGSNLYVSARGKIIWKKDAWYNCVAGVRFHDMDKETSGRIADFLSSKRNKSFGASLFHDNTGTALSLQDKKQESATGPFFLKALDVMNTADDIETEKTSDAGFTVSLQENNEEPIPQSAGPSATAKEKKKKAYIAPIAILLIVSASALYFMMNHSQKEPSAIPAHSADTVSSQNDKEQPLIPESSTETGALSLQRAIEPGQLKVAPVQEAEKETPVKPVSDSTEKETYESKPASTEKSEGEITPLFDSGIKSAAEAETEAVKAENAALQNPQEGEGLQLGKTKDQNSSPPQEDFATYDEAFTENSNNWDVFNTGMASARIEKGEYLIENKRKAGAHIVLNHMDLLDKTDFITEVSIRPVKNLENFSFGLVVNDAGGRFYGFIFGAEDASHYNSFQISEDGFYSISTYQNAVSKVLRSGKIKKAADSQNPLNTLKVIKQGDNIRFYINDDYLDEISNLSFYGKKAGFIIDGGLKIAVDKIHTQTKIH